MLFMPIYKVITFKFVIKADTVDTEFGSFVFKSEVLEFSKVFILRLYYKDT